MLVDEDHYHHHHRVVEEMVGTAHGRIQKVQHLNMLNSSRAVHGIYMSMAPTTLDPPLVPTRTYR